MPTPEELARENIDEQLRQAGWLVQDSYSESVLKDAPTGNRRPV
jgi:type I site-specific restriction endonuclease